MPVSCERRLVDFPGDFSRCSRKFWIFRSVNHWHYFTHGIDCLWSKKSGEAYNKYPNTWFIQWCCMWICSYAHNKNIDVHSNGEEETECEWNVVFEEYVWNDLYLQTEKLRIAEEDWCCKGINRKSRTGNIEVEVVGSCGENGRGVFGREDCKIYKSKALGNTSDQMSWVE